MAKHDTHEVKQKKMIKTWNNMSKHSWQLGQIQ